MSRVDIHVDEGGVEVPREDEIEGDAAWVRSGGGAAAATAAFVVFVLEGVGPFTLILLSYHFLILLVLPFLPLSLPFLRMELGYPSSLLLLRVSFSGGKGFLSFLLRLLLCG